MPPKRGKKKSGNNNDDEFQEQDKIMEQKLAKLLLQQQKNKKQDAQGDAQEIYTKPNKAVFDYDFSNVKKMEKKQPIKIVQKDKYADLTSEQKQELEKMREKARIDKAEKQKYKKQKQDERKKAAEILKAKEQVQKQKLAEEQKKVQEEITKNKNKQGSPLIIPLVLLLFIILMGVLQYNKEIHERLAKFKIQTQDNIYQILEVDEGATNSQIKTKYKKLVLKYHPDRNPDCENCKQKFQKIMKAWEILGDPEKRQSYDQNNGYVSQIKSSSITLTPRNYHYLVQQSRHIWMIQVYDSTDQNSRYFAQFWQELSASYGDIIKFGRIDIWHQSDMTSYIPYRFQIFPAVYTYDGGYTEICDVNLQEVMGSMKRCIEQVSQKAEINLINEELTEKELQIKLQGLKQDGKIQIVLNSRLRANIRVKAINKIFDKYYSFYYLNTAMTKREAKVYRSGLQIKDKSVQVFEFIENTKKVFESYKNFLESFIVLEMSLCNFLTEFEDRKCSIVLDSSKIQKIKQNMPLSKQKNIPTIYLTDVQQKLNMEVEKIKNATQMYENFDLGVYLGGRIDLGYFNEVDELIPDEGELLQLQCKVYFWKEKVINFVGELLQKTLA